MSLMSLPALDFISIQDGILLCLCGMGGSTHKGSQVLDFSSYTAPGPASPGHTAFTLPPSPHFFQLALSQPHLMKHLPLPWKSILGDSNRLNSAA